VRDAHVVGDDVHQQAHAAFPQAFGEFSELFLRTNFGIEASMVGDVVAVHAAGMGHQERGGIAVCDSQIVQIRNHSGCLGKGKPQIELQTIGRTRDISRFQ